MSGTSSRVSRHQAVPPRERVISAAATLFAEHGYAATSIRQIAGAARVSLDTVYSWGGKAEIFLQCMEIALSGNSDGTPLLEGPGMNEVWQAATLEQVVAGLVEVTVAGDQRSVSMWAAFVEGARSDATLSTALAAKNDAMRAEGRKAIDFLKERGLCADTIDTARVADLIWAEAHPNRYALLVGLAGWTTEQFAAQLIEAVLALLRD